MTTDEDADDSQKSMTRRATLSGAGVVAGGWLLNKLTGGAVSVANAQQSQEYRIAITGDNPTWAIDDESQGDGTTDLIFRHVPSDTTVRWDRSENEWDFSQVSSFVVDSLTANTVDSQTVNAEKADITNETLIAAYRTSNKSSLSSATYHTVELDASKKDERSEFDATTHQVTVDETGWYHVYAQVRFNNLSTGDILIARLRNVSDGTTLARYQSASPGPSDVAATPVVLAEIPSGKNIEFQVRNENSSFGITGGEHATFLDIRRAMR